MSQPRKTTAADERKTDRKHRQNPKISTAVLGQYHNPIHDLKHRNHKTFKPLISSRQATKMREDL